MSACNKFVPNFFNKNKCQNCFKFKNCHNDQASLEQNQTVRTIVRCNFLFVTPECHSTLSINKVRKFQRRWFILYSNGELTYSLDQSSLTLPQNRILLTECDHISLAPDVHEHAIAIVYLDKVYYIRANHLDEAQQWFDDLSHFLTNNRCQSTSNNAHLHKDTTAQQATGKQCVVVDAVHKVKQENVLNNQQENRNPVFKLLSYVNKSANSVDYSNGDQSERHQINHQNDQHLTHQNDQSDHQVNFRNKVLISDKIRTIDDCTVIKSKRNKSLPDLRITQRDHRTKETNSTEQSRNQKSSWLMRRRDQTSKEWYRHWFCLKDSLLTYYRDRPTIESNSLLNGVFDLSLVKRVHCSNASLTLNRSIYYPFTIVYNNKEHELAALTNESRDEWIRLIVDSSQSQFISKNCASASTIDRRITTNSDVDTDESIDSTNQVFSNLNAMISSPVLNRSAISRMKHKSKDSKISNCKLSTKSIKSPESPPESTANNCANDSVDNQVDSGLASSDDQILNRDSIDQINQLDHLEPIDCKDNELSRIKFSIVELHKFCLSIVNELQLTHSDLNQIKQNLVQKDFFGMLLSNHLLNGTNAIDTLLEQFNLIKQSYQTPTTSLDRQQSEQLNNSTSDHASDLHQSEHTSDLHQSEHTSDLHQSEHTSDLHQSEHTSDLHQSEHTSDQTSKVDEQQNQTKSNNQIEQPTQSIQPTMASEDASDRIYLTRKQFDTLLNKNQQLENRLRISLRTLQSLNTELKESNENYDYLEILFLYIQRKFQSMFKIKQDEYELMKLKIDYLTSKLVAVEKAYRTSVSKLAELEASSGSILHK